MPSSLFDAIDDLPATTLQADIAKLLSASSYQHTTTRAAREDVYDEQMYGGIVTAFIGSEDGEEHSRPAKRSKTNQTNPAPSAKDVPKRQRGRPKVSGQDETAAERRRTQIRLAQRAYRNRKENTITDLSQKVEEMQTTMKNLNTGFARLRESLLTTGLIHAGSPVMGQVDTLMRQLAEALESNRSDVDRPSDADDNEPQGQEIAYDRDQFSIMDGSDVPLNLQGQTPPATSEPASSSLRKPLGVSTGHNKSDVDDQNLTNNQTSPASLTTYLTPSVSTETQLVTHEQQSSSNTNLVLTSIERFPLKSAYTYSFQESTFSRRLHRLCIERSFKKLLNPHVDPEWLTRTFRLTFNFSNRERVIRAFKEILGKGTDEALENWRSPYIAVGGAGLHFPRRDAAGKVIFPPNLLNPVRVATQWRIPDSETVPVAGTFDDVLDSVGFSGEWFDCHDVEEYLKTKGIYPEPQSSFFLVDSALVGQTVPALSDVLGTLTASSISTPLSHHSPGWDQLLQVHGPDRSLQNKSQSGESPVLPQDAAVPGTSVDQWLGQQEDFVPNAFDIELAQPLYNLGTKETRMLTVEVEKFLERLSDQSVCLGRAPGFRKEAVDNALALAMEEAF